MAIAQRLSRYHAFVRLMSKYGGLAAGDVENAKGDPADPGPLQFASDLEALGPTFIKLGQFLSSRADLLPPAYVDALARLQDNVAPFPFAEAMAIVEEDLDVRRSKVFREIDQTPIAAASLGQVYRAVLRDGREVAVKVQRPGVRERVAADLDALSDVAALLARLGRVSESVDLPQLLEEFRRTLAAEVDYRQEAHNLRSLAESLRRFTLIVVPLPVDDLSGARVLTMAYVPGVRISSVGRVEWTEIDGARLANTLFRAYLQQVLVDGCFHADPHPGNILLTPEHRLGLIDLGMVGRLAAPMQDKLFRLLLAIADGRGDEAATIIIGFGQRRETFDEPRIRRTVMDIVGQHRQLSARELRVGRVMLDMVRNGSQCGLRMAPELALLGKTLVQLEEIGRILDPDFDVTASMRRNAVGLMRRRTLTAMTPARAFSSALELRDFTVNLPARANQIFDALARNDFRVKIELIDHGSIIDGLQKVANRIALALVLAAALLGASMLMRVPTAFSILGYPGLAVLLFLAAAGGGAWMAWTIVTGDVRRPRVR